MNKTNCMTGDLRPSALAIPSLQVYYLQMSPRALGNSVRTDKGTAPWGQHVPPST